MAKRRRLHSTVASDPYLVELNKKVSAASMSSCSSSAPATRAPATGQSSYEYLEHLNQRRNYASENRASNGSASGESCRDQLVLGSPASGSASGESRQPDSAVNSFGLSQRRVASVRGLKLTGKLGAGTFGTVFSCIWQGRQLAVKVFRKNERALRDAAREVKLLKHLHTQRRCALVCHLQAWRKTGRTYRLFFERFYADLAQFLSRHRDAGVGVRVAMRITINLTTSLAFLQESCVIHRDIKPGNILLRMLRSNENTCQPTAEHNHQPAAVVDQWQAVLADFGNSAIVQHKRAAEGNVSSVATWAETGRPLSRRVCTLWYAAPEMLMPREPYDYSADIWSLGLVLLEIEALEAACPARPDAPDWEQLEACWSLCQPAAAPRLRQPAAAPRGFIARAQRVFARRRGSGWLSRGLPSPSHARGRVGARYGLRFRAFAFRLVEFVPQRRVHALPLSRSCQETFAYWLHDSWLLDC